MTVSFGPPVTRRLIIKGVGAVALVGLGHAAFGPWPALAAANDKYPEDAFKQKGAPDTIKALYGKDHEPSDKISKKVLDEILVGDNVEASAIVHTAIEEYAQELGASLAGVA